MRTTVVPRSKGDSTWRRWLRRLRDFEDVMTMSETEILGARVSAIERELRRLRALLGEGDGPRPAERETSREQA